MAYSMASLEKDIMAPQHAQKFGSFIFMLIGGVFAVIGTIFMYQSVQLAVNGIKTAGEVLEVVRSTDSDGDTTYKPVVRFQTETGETTTFTSKVSSSSFNYSVGRSVNVLYPAADPDSAAIDSAFTMWAFPGIFMAFGYGFMGIGGYMLYRDRARKALIEQLKISGQRIDARVTEVGQNTSYKVNGRSPFCIFAQAEINGGIEIFKSDNLWFNPEQFVKVGQTVQVLYDPASPKNYYLDTSFLPKLNG